jgi:hypothetical protein
MKKFFTLFFALFVMAFCAKAQVFLQEGFENADLPSGWTTIDNDGDGNDWYILLNSQSSSGSFNVHSGEGHITSASYAGVALTPDNWLITPAVSLTGTPKLSFWVAGQDPSYAAEYFAVYISTTGATVADFTTELTHGTATGDMTEYTADLSAYAGQTVYIAFRHYNVSDMFRLNLDDVVISDATGIDNLNNTVFTIYPNPATDILTVNGEGLAEVYNTLGQMVISENVNGNAQLNVSNLESGVYFVRMNGATQRFIKK